MLRYVSDVTSTALAQALNGQAARQRATADNLANVDTPGYRPRQVMFEDQLRHALDSEEANPGDPDAAAEVARVQPQTISAPGPALRRDGNAVDLEGEMVGLAESQLHYSALVKLLSHKLSMIKSVATEGAKS
jgi:flagellar basal-body rod protein FlgB